MGVRAPATMTDVDMANLLVDVTRRLTSARRLDVGDRGSNLRRWTRSSLLHSRARRATCSPACRSRDLPGRVRAARGRRDVRRRRLGGQGPDEVDPASARCPCPSSPPTRPTSRSWRPRSTSTPSGPRSSSPSPRSGSSTVSARSRSGGRATPSTTTSSDRTPPGVVLRVGSAVRNWRPGDKVTVHCNYVDDQDPTRPRRLDARGQPAHLGVRDELRRARRHRRREGQPAHAEARAPHLGGGGGQRPVQLHGLPDARLAQRRAGHPGRQACSSGGRPAASAASPSSTC